VVAALGVVMIFTWGGTFYLMAVLAAPIAAETGWHLEAVTGAFSAALLVAGLLSPAVGRIIARRGGKPVLAAGCGLIGLGLGLIALAPSWPAFLLGWLVIGAGMAAGLYDPAFASLTRLYGAEARAAITQLTLWGGFASTVCWPLSAWLLDAVGWRGTAAAYAAIALGLLLPLVWRGLPDAPPTSLAAAPATPEAPPADPGRDGGALTPREAVLFALMVAVGVVHGLMVVIVSTWLFVFLTAQGLTLAAAVGLGALIGPAQVAGRLGEVAAGGRHHPIWTLSVALAAIAAGLGLLAAGVGPPGLALILFGAGNGLYSIAKGALPLALFGAARYPVLIGRAARPALMAQAAAPLCGAWVIAWRGAEAGLTLVAMLAAVNLALLVVLWGVHRRRG
jgi:predicted MFS family arabinose efflux permease